MMTEDRAISLNAVIKAVDEHTNDDGTLDDDISCILEDLPPVKPQEPKAEKVIKMRDATPEERESIYKYINSISKPTGVDFWDLEQEPKTGHWIQTNEFFINQDGQFIYKFICSECKSLSYFRKSNKKAIGANVCPNCGADMRGDDNADNS